MTTWKDKEGAIHYLHGQYETIIHEPQNIRLKDGIWHDLGNAPQEILLPRKKCIRISISTVEPSSDSKDFTIVREGPLILQPGSKEKLFVRNHKAPVSIIIKRWSYKIAQNVRERICQFCGKPL